MSKSTKQTNGIDKTNPIKDTAGSIADYISKFLIEVVDLENGVDKQGTIQEIRDKKSMSGANAWMLMCSIVIASIGLSQDSQAVIIGAMLISPLMSPILGIGLSVGINDIVTMKKSLAHFGIAILIALTTSTIYFSILDFPEITQEIQARTRPTFLDIFVAIFGGVAGIISIARKDVSTTLPGVAIATALMPPLCVCGYGIANGEIDIALRSFYLFFLNTFFVSLSTYLMVRFLRFPFKEFVDTEVRKKNSRYILIFSLLLIVPSILIFKGVVEELAEKSAIKRFIKECIAEKEVYLDDYQLTPESNGNRLLYLKCYGNVINKSNESAYESCLSSKGLKGVDIKIISSSDVDLAQVRGLEKNISEINTQLSVVNQARIDQNRRMMSMQNGLIDSTLFDEISKELDVLFPELESISMAKMRSSDFVNLNSSITSIILTWENQENDLQKKNMIIEAFLKERMNLDTILVVNR